MERWNTMEISYTCEGETARVEQSRGSYDWTQLLQVLIFKRMDFLGQKFR